MAERKKSRVGGKLIPCATGRGLVSQNAASGELHLVNSIWGTPSGELHLGNSIWGTPSGELHLGTPSGYSRARLRHQQLGQIPTEWRGESTTISNYSAVATTTR